MIEPPSQRGGCAEHQSDIPATGCVIEVPVVWYPDARLCPRRPNFPGRIDGANLVRQISEC
jgi:hypothetical protein